MTTTKRITRRFSNAKLFIFWVTRFFGFIHPCTHVRFTLYFSFHNNYSCHLSRNRDGIFSFSHMFTCSCFLSFMLNAFTDQTFNPSPRLAESGISVTSRRTQSVVKCIFAAQNRRQETKHLRKYKYKRIRRRSGRGGWVDGCVGGVAGEVCVCVC